MDEGWVCKGEVNSWRVSVGGMCVWLLGVHAQGLGYMHKVLGGIVYKEGSLESEGGSLHGGNRAVSGCEHTQPQGALLGCTVLSPLPALTWELHRALLGSPSTLCLPALRNHSAKVYAVLHCVQPWRSKAKSSCVNSEQDAVREVARVLLLLRASFLLP